MVLWRASAGQPPDDEPSQVVVGARARHPAREVECGAALAVRHEHQGDDGAVARVAAAIGRFAGDGGRLGQRTMGGRGLDLRTAMVGAQRVDRDGRADHGEAQQEQAGGHGAHGIVRRRS